MTNLYFSAMLRTVAKKCTLFSACSNIKENNVGIIIIVIYGPTMGLATCQMLAP